MGEKIQLNVSFGSGPTDRNTPKNWIYTDWNKIDLINGSKSGAEYAMGMIGISLGVIYLF